MLARLPATEGAWEPCIGQVDEFASKRCTLLPVAADKVLEDTIARIGEQWDIDTSLLQKGLPVIRYLPGAPPVGVHGDKGASGLVPNATLVLYLTDGEGASGQTFFPEAGVEVTPRRGSILSWMNINAEGVPDPAAKHGVRAVSKQSSGDRFVVQIPIIHHHGKRGSAYPEHVSGMKKHTPAMHNDDKDKPKDPPKDATSASGGMCTEAGKAMQNCVIL